MDTDTEKVVKRYRRHYSQYVVLCNGIDHWRIKLVRPDMMLIESKRYAGLCDCVEE